MILGAGSVPAMRAVKIDLEGRLTVFRGEKDTGRPQMEPLMVSETWARPLVLTVILSRRRCFTQVEYICCAVLVRLFGPLLCLGTLGVDAGSPMAPWSSLLRRPWGVPREWPLRRIFGCEQSTELQKSELILRLDADGSLSTLARSSSVGSCFLFRHDHNWVLTRSKAG
jgi:hypothetical protein